MKLSECELQLLNFVIRMKNVELIELGKHKIKPWYFSPYPIELGRTNNFLCVSIVFVCVYVWE